MTKPYFKLPAICVIILSIFNVNAQEIRNLSFSVQGNSVEITYDLVAGASDLFRIEVFSIIKVILTWRLEFREGSQQEPYYKSNWDYLPWITVNVNIEFGFSSRSILNNCNSCLCLNQ